MSTPGPDERTEPLDPEPSDLDSQTIEVLGRNALVNSLLRAGIEVARPERDRGVDLLAYLDKDFASGRFSAVPIQMKATTKASFSVSEKYAAFPSLVMAHVWNVMEAEATVIYALTYSESLDLAGQMGWLKTKSWTEKEGKGHYVSTSPSKALREALEPYRASVERWHHLVAEGRQAHPPGARSLVGEFALGEVVPIETVPYTVVEVFINGAVAVPTASA